MRDFVRRYVVALLLSIVVVAGCNDSTLVHCDVTTNLGGDMQTHELLCPPLSICVPAGCATVQEASACLVGDRPKDDGTPCMIPGDDVVRVCTGGACLPAICGDGLQGFGEACDDGNRVGQDGCSADCKSNESCGNGVVDVLIGETCDDQNTDETDGCHHNCQVAKCGDGEVDAAFGGEACDDGPNNSREPNAACRPNCQPKRCGDGIQDVGEVCDDGNLTSGDGCSGDCLSAETCGNGYVDRVNANLESIEQCDDGNQVADDNCDNNCHFTKCGNGQIEGIEQCDRGPQNSDAPDAECRSNCRPQRCGDGVQDSNEVCDDGNTAAGDHCSFDCKSLEVCGNGIVDTLNPDLPNGEACDDPDRNKCTADCKIPDCGNGVIERNEQCDEGLDPVTGMLRNSNTPDARCRPDCRISRCGDFVVDPNSHEICDDGNNVAGDGCSADCRSLEVCGNAIADPAAGEACDDGNASDLDGCSTECKIPGCGDGRPRADLGEECDLGVLNSNAPNERCRLNCQLRKCGDGIVDADEACDDFNNMPGDGCSADCRSRESCGNAYVDLAKGEACDDGNTVDTDGCTNSCRVPGCGNGMVDAGEQCDDGFDTTAPFVNSIAPGARCRPDCRIQRCGDAVTDPGEACDDGNATSGDGCAADCSSTEACGNHIIDVQSGEACDDGNRVDNDTCNNACRVPGCGDGGVDIGEACDLGINNSNTPDALCRLDCSVRRCGDGVRDTLEACDDGNTASGDGCSQGCDSTEVCGNGVKDELGGEACDDGNHIDADGCRNNCTIPGCGDGLLDALNGETCDLGGANSNLPDATCRVDCQPARCGDAIVDTGETCDDGNNISGDLCAGDCKSNEVCGNGVVDTAAGEACDDGNNNNADRCRNDCTITGCGDGFVDVLNGETCDAGADNSNAPNALCRVNCQRAGCGDDIRDNGEVCDDGNRDSGDGCAADCLSTETCGNGVTDTANNEQCDDGNVSDRDACHANCKVPVCGDGVYDPQNGEGCDAGLANSNQANAACRNNCQPQRCGDGVQDAGEVCDDGNNIGGDNCAADCKSTEVCGNGVVDPLRGEACDDGNRVDNDSCSNTCRLALCGNGAVDGGTGEVCDLGGNNSNLPNATCRLNCQPRRCGDGIIDAGEVCDDNNAVGGDGCSADCRSTEVCRNGVVDNNEQCDDNNANDGDSCRNNCLIPRCGDGVVDTQNGEACDNGNSNSNAPNALCRTNCQANRCGDGVRDAGEVCDDGNHVSGDGCNASCTSLEVCRNGVVDLNEACDDGNTVDSDQCHNNCTIPRCGDGVLDLQSGESCDAGSNNSNAVNAACRPNCQPKRCGDAVKDTGEQCDDGNTIAGDGCSATCASLEVCGNGIVDTVRGEQCDDGNGSNADNCHTDCRVPRCGDGVFDSQNGEQCDSGAANGNVPNGCRLQCRLPSCGDGVLDTSTEVCDDGNRVAGDGCASTCLSNETCGNGVVDSVRGEQCDDHNLRSADGCSSVCRAEALTWIEASPLPPAARYGHAMVYDANNGQTLVFGGVLSGGSLSNETWLWTGGHWENLTSTLSVAPAPRRNAAIAYDPTSRRVVMFGGFGSTGPLGDTWMWTGAAWQLLNPIGGTHPEARGAHAMAAYTTAKALILFGGNGVGPEVFADTWSFDVAANRWSRLTPTGQPGGRAGATLTMVPTTGELLLLGGGDDRGVLLGDGWSYQGNQWKLLDSIPGGVVGRQFHATMWSLPKQALIVVGGTDSANQLVTTAFVSHDAEWLSLGSIKATQLAGALDRDGRSVIFGGLKLPEPLADFFAASPDGSWQAIAPEQPPARSNAAAIYVPFMGHIVMATGGGADGPLSDTYLWHRDRWQDSGIFEMKREGARMCLVENGSSAVLLGGESTGAVSIWNGADWLPLGATLLSPTAPVVALMEEKDGSQLPVASYGNKTFTYGAQGNLHWVDVGAAPADINSAAWSTVDNAWIAHARTTDYRYNQHGWDSFVSELSRDSAALVYDTVAQRSYLLGGIDKPQMLITDDVWQRSGDERGAVWTLVTAAAPWFARVNPAISYDSQQRQLVMFGGENASGHVLGDTWLGRLADDRPREVCQVDRDTDADGLAGCEDPDCAGICAPNGCVAASCPQGSCGDNVCSETELAGGGCAICPADCGVCAATCGDGHCASGEAEQCPGDCTR